MLAGYDSTSFEHLGSGSEDVVNSRDVALFSVITEVKGEMVGMLIRDPIRISLKAFIKVIIMNMVIVGINYSI